jgi:hypothetical protein
VIVARPVVNKLCHAKPGDVVRLLSPRQLVPIGEPYMVCVDPHSDKPARATLPQDLYADERRLFLVSLSTGLVRTMPHLSQRMEIIRDAVVFVPAAEVAS